MTIRNGQYVNISVSRLSIHDCTISNVFFLVYVNVSVSGFLIPDCHISKVFFLCMSMSVSLDWTETRKRR
jgi:hypothetical protein